MARKKTQPARRSAPREGGGQGSARGRAEAGKAKAGAPVRDMAVTLRMSPQEYQLISYAASKSRARGIQMWMRERLLDAAREKVPEKTVENIIEGKATADLLRESLKEARTGKTARVLEFGGRGKQDEE